MSILRGLFLSLCVQSVMCLNGLEFPYHPTHEVTLISGLQINPHPVTSDSQEAKAYFNQGLNLIYGFNKDAAYWSFQKAVALDENFAMGYWGLSLALGNNINNGVDDKAEKIAFKHISKARQLADKVTTSEKDYIEALSKRFTDDKNPDLKKLSLDYRDAMKELKSKYPDDPDAATLYAESIMDTSPWNQWTEEGEPLPGTLETVEALESVLKRNPLHLGANHYYIHAVEGSKHPEYALISADRLRKLVPALGHILHMPSHIYILVGDYHQASNSNEAAVATDLSYIKQFGMEGMYPLHYLSHSYYYLIRSLGMEGRLRSALKAANDLNTFYLPYVKEVPSLEYYLSAKMFVLSRFHQWEELIAMEKPNAKAEVSLPITEALWHFSRAIAYTELNDEKNVLKERAAFIEGRQKIPEKALFGFISVTPVFKIAENILEAKIAKLQKNSAKEIEFLREAVKIQDTLGYNGVVDWYFGVKEMLGGALLQDKQYKQAENIFREDLNVHPRSGRSLFGLLQSLKEQSRTADSYFVQKEYENAWQYADAPLTPSDL